MRRKIHRALYLLLWLLPTLAAAQKEGNIWYFGIKAGLDFNGGDPVPLLDGQLSTSEGCASIADNKGNLLFYTEGINVWDRQHNRMPNGNQLNGDGSSTQSGVIVPLPGKPSIYLIFTVDNNGGPNGLCYSIVDLTKNSGMGDVTTKNVQLLTPSTEKITAVFHQNKKDIWVIGHKWESDEFVAYLVDSGGVSKSVSSKVGTPHQGSINGSIGQMTASSDGKKIAITTWHMNMIELFDFDHATGRVTNPLTLPSSEDEYGVAFSPDNTKLYFASWGISGASFITQFDLSAGSPSKIIASRQVILMAPGSYFGSAQLGTNGKIYIARPGIGYLAVIHEPNKYGAACGFILNGISLAGKTSGGGLPTIIQSYFLPGDILSEEFCLGEPTLFSLKSTSNIDSLLWDFGDPASGMENYATTLSARHTYTQAGFHIVRLTYYIEDKKFNTSSEVEIFTYPKVILPRDTIICANTSLAITPVQLSGKTYIWSNGESSASITIDSPGTYWLEAANGSCRVSDSIVITPYDPGKLDLGMDMELCDGESTQLKADMQGKYRWNDGSSGNSLWINKAGTYWVEVRNDCGTFIDSIKIDYTFKPVSPHWHDTLLCDDAVWELNAGNPGSEYRWQDGSRSNTYIAAKVGTYWVEISNRCGIIADTVIVAYDKAPTTELGADTVICEGGSYYLDAGSGSGWYYRWQDSSALQQYLVQKPGKYEVEIRNSCGSVKKAINIYAEDCHCYLYVPDAFTPGNDTLNETFKPSACPTREYYFVIYNRWGERIYETDNIDAGWDGAYKGQAAPVGMYIYMLKAQGRDWEQYYQSGRFYLIK